MSVSIFADSILVLKSLGYLPKHFSSYGEAARQILQSIAVRRFQRNHDLEETGILDQEMAAVITGRTCGAPDIVDGMNLTRISSGEASCFTLFPGGPRWATTHLTYSLERNVPEAARPAIKRAFAEWNRVRPQFTFTEIPAGGYIKIGFYRGKHGTGDCSAFNGPGGVLAHTFRPCDDLIQQWSYLLPIASPHSQDLESVILHEIGHALGLNHSSDKNAVMYPTIDRGDVKNKLTKDDISGLDFLYGNF